MLAGCEREDPTFAADRRGVTSLTVPDTAAPNPIDESQVAAFEAGKELIGRPAPKLMFKTIDGAPISLGQVHADRPTYLKFWATWCATCRAQMDAFKVDFARYGKHLDVVAVNIGVNEDRATVERYRREVSLPMPIVIDDGRLGDALRLKVTPQHVIIGRDGTIRYVGHLDDQRLQDEIEAAIADRPISTTLPVQAIVSEAPAVRLSPDEGSLASVQGGQVRISGAAAGAPRLLYFLSPWCETYLKDSRPAMARACKDTRETLAQLTRKGRAQVIGIASGLSTDADGVRRYIAQTGFDVPIVIDEDGRLFRQFAVRSFPTVIRLDASGRPERRLALGELVALARRSTI